MRSSPGSLAVKLLPADEEAKDRGSERWSGSPEDARLESDRPSGTRTPSSPAPAPRACARARARSPLLCRDARVPEAAADPPWTGERRGLGRTLGGAGKPGRLAPWAQAHADLRSRASAGSPKCQNPLLIGRRLRARAAPRCVWNAGRRQLLISCTTRDQRSQASSSAAHSPWGWGDPASWTGR